MHRDLGCQSSGSYSHRYPTHFTLLAAVHPGAHHRPQPSLADFQPSGTVLGPLVAAVPDDHGTLVTGQTWQQPQRLGAREGIHCLLKDAFALILVRYSRVSCIGVFGMRSETCRKRSPSGEQTGADWSCGRQKPELCIYFKSSGPFQQTLLISRPLFPPRLETFDGGCNPHSTWSLTPPFGFLNGLCITLASRL